MASITHRFPGVTREALLRRNLRRHARFPVMFVLLAALITLISIPYLYLDAKANNLALDIVALSFERAENRGRIAEYELDLATAQSMDRVVKGSEAIGLRQSKDVQVLRVDLGQTASEDSSTLGILADGLGRLRDSFLTSDQESSTNQ